MGAKDSVGESGSFEIEFEGERIRARAGESLAATLIAAGRLHVSTDRQGRPRGPYCGMGVCHDCLVIVDGRSGERACLTPARAGQRIQRQPPKVACEAPGLADLAPPPQAEAAAREVEILIVGAGPAGLSAARAARACGAEVVILDERPYAGGQYYKPRVTAGGAPDAQAREGHALVEAVRAAGVEIAADTVVWGAERDGEGRSEVFAFAQGQARRYRPRMLIVATGAYEKPTMVPGWTLPGVMTTGAGQTLARGYGVAAGRKVLVTGNGPLNLQVAAELSDLGAEVVVAEAAPAPWTRPGEALALASADIALAGRGAAMLARLRRAGVPVHWGHRLTAVEGESAARRAWIAPIDATGATDAARKRVFDIDAVLTGDGFLPADELARLLGRSRGEAMAGSDLFVVGEARSFGGAGVALAEGEIAGCEAARRLGYAAPESASARARLARNRRFQSALWALFAAPPRRLGDQPGSTVVCRCEGIDLDALRACVARHGVGDLATLKRLTRAGMGRCQGRYCGGALCETFGFTEPSGDASAWAPQMPLRPVPLAALPVEQPEWFGHKRSLLPPAEAVAPEPLDVADVDVLIVGAGVAGLSTALFLARAGRECLVIDQNWPNAGASGGNAGSLHAQLLSFDFGASDSGGMAARTLGFQAESIRLWAALQQELDVDFEMKMTGGLMLAETDDDLAHLEAKTRLERTQGVECHVIGRDRLRQLEPALDPSFVGAAWCPLEGKINPLTATQALLDAARRAGAGVVPLTTVLGIERAPDGFLVRTSRGNLRARRIVNAAGGFAARVGAMLGLDVPVHGAPLQMIVTEPAEPLLSHLVAHSRRHLSLKQTAAGSFLIGGGWTAGLDPVHHHPRPTRASLQGNLWVAQHVLPALRKLRVVRSWGAMNIDIDGGPIVGEHPDAPGFFNAVTSNGYTLGPIMGKTTAELLVNGRAERDISAFGIERFSGRGRP